MLITAKARLKETTLSILVKRKFPQHALFTAADRRRMRVTDDCSLRIIPSAVEEEM